jgi:hypothetical protein
MILESFSSVWLSRASLTVLSVSFLSAVLGLISIADFVFYLVVVWGVETVSLLLFFLSFSSSSIFCLAETPPPAAVSPHTAWLPSISKS